MKRKISIVNKAKEEKYYTLSLIRSHRVGILLLVAIRNPVRPETKTDTFVAYGLIYTSIFRSSNV